MINYDLTQIKSLIFDVDGVLSRSEVYLWGGEPVRTSHTKDGYALQLAAKKGLKLVIITGGKNEAIRERYLALGFKHIFMGASSKLDVFDDLVVAEELHPHEILYMGDDIPDFEIMKKCGCPCCPADAVKEIKEISLYISDKKGGEGCVRDVVEQVLKAQNKWESLVEAFGW